MDEFEMLLGNDESETYTDAVEVGGFLFDSKVDAEDLAAAILAYLGIEEKKEAA